MPIVVENEAGLGHSDQRAVGGASDAEDQVAAILVKIHHAHLEPQHVARMRLGAVRNREVGDDTACSIFLDLGYAMLE
ncbi:hypothetical protein D3C79_1067770 [compost metagenome]